LIDSRKEASVQMTSKRSDNKIEATQACDDDKEEEGTRQTEN